MHRHRAFYNLPYRAYRPAGDICEKCQKRIRPVGVYGTQTEVNVYLNALIFLRCEKNISIYSQMGFQFYQSHRVTAMGLKSGKKSINWVSVGILETLW